MFRKLCNHIRRIVVLREQGLQYREIDAVLNLPYRSYRFMRSAKVRRLRLILAPETC